MSVDLTGQRLGHYLVHEVIGRGGMSVVYRAIDERLERSVALKVMSENLSADPEFRARFLEEARAASAIDHVNVVPLYDFGEQAGALFIAMRLVDGTDLARELSGGPLPVRRVMSLLSQVGAALDLLHERGLVHLDVKPANVLITRNESAGNEHVYLADFGLTRRGKTGHQTASGDFLGSPTYASPEHLRGQEVGPRSDEYSFTCMLFTALAGRAPFIGDVRTVITGHLSGVVPSLSALTGLPSALDRVIARGLAADPEQRYATSSDVLSAARRAISSAEPDPPPASSPQPSSHQQYAPPTTVQPTAVQPTTVQPSFEPPPTAQPWGGQPHRPATPSGPSGAEQRPSWTQVTPVAAGPVVGSSASGPGWPASGQIRPMDFGPDSTGRRPASHRIEPVRAKRWPWLALVGALLVVAAAVIFVVSRGSGSGDGPSAPAIAPPAGSSSPAPTTPPTVRASTVATGSTGTSTGRATGKVTGTVLQPSVLPTGLRTVSGLPNPFTSSG